MTNNHGFLLGFTMEFLQGIIYDHNGLYQLGEAQVDFILVKIKIRDFVGLKRKCGKVSVPVN